jgi:hypothetical protein
MPQDADRLARSVGRDDAECMDKVPLLQSPPPGPKLDLDAAAAEIEKRRPAWLAAGFAVGELTWRDQAPGWPYPLVSRAEAKSPDSVGVRCVRGQVEFSVVVFDGEWSPEQGGWADVEGGNLDTGDIEMTAPEIPDIAAFGRLLDQVFERWASLPSE